MYMHTCTCLHLYVALGTQADVSYLVSFAQKWWPLRILVLSRLIHCSSKLAFGAFGIGLREAACQGCLMASPRKPPDLCSHQSTAILKAPCSIMVK